MNSSENKDEWFDRQPWWVQIALMPILLAIGIIFVPLLFLYGIVIVSTLTLLLVGFWIYHLIAFWQWHRYPGDRATLDEVRERAAHISKWFERQKGNDPEFDDFFGNTPDLAKQLVVLSQQTPLDATACISFVEQVASELKGVKGPPYDEIVFCSRRLAELANEKPSN